MSEEMAARLQRLEIPQRMAAAIAFDEVPPGASPSEGLAALECMTDAELLAAKQRYLGSK